MLYFLQLKDLSPTLFFFSSRRRHTRSTRDWSSDVCSSDLVRPLLSLHARGRRDSATLAVRGVVRFCRARRGGDRRHPGGHLVSRFLDAARMRPADATPVWLMRQAGRSLPEYRRLRERWTLADIVAQADLCAEVTLQPVRRLGVDAAVMFADIMLPVRGMGVDFELVDGVGPVIANPIASVAQIESLRVPDG